VTSTHPRGQSAAPRLAILIGLLVIAVVSAGVFVWVAATRTSADSGSPVERVVTVFQGSHELQDQREDVMSQAEQFMLRVNTYGPDLLDERGQMPKYRELVTEIITAKFRTSFEGGVTAAEQTVDKAGVSRTAKVFAVGVAAIDEDTATALVAGSFTNSYPVGKQGERVSDDPSPFRVSVTLVKTDGTWLVDNFAPVTGEEAS
jgi:Mce-associated membrane protein